MFFADYFDDGYFDVEYWGSFLVAPDWSLGESAAGGVWVDENAKSDVWTDTVSVATTWSSE